MVHDRHRGRLQLLHLVAIRIDLTGIAVWHFAVLVPDRFAGGIIGALLAALGGALASGYLLPLPGVPSDNPPGFMAAFWALPGALVAMAISYWSGSRRIQRNS